MSSVFYLFAGDRYYPAGGAGDFIGHDEDQVMLRERALGLPAERDDDEYGELVWWHIADSNMLIVEEGEYPQKPLGGSLMCQPTSVMFTSDLPPEVKTFLHCIGWSRCTPSWWSAWLSSSGGGRRVRWSGSTSSRSRRTTMPDPVICACCDREPDAACRHYHCPHYGPQAAVTATGLPSLIDRLIPPQPDIRLVLQDWPHDLPGGLIGNTVEQGPPYNLYEPRARIAEAMIQPDLPEHDRLWESIYGDHLDARDDGEHRPFRVFEFGALLGYGIGAVSHRLGAHRVVAGWVDNESHTPGSNTTCAENLRSIGLDCWWGDDRRESPGFERADVVLVDGDHSFAGTMDDLAYAYRLRPRLVFVDDHIPEHAGVVAAVRTIREAKVRVPTVNGLVVVAMREGASVRGLGALVESCGLEWEEIR